MPEAPQPPVQDRRVARRRGAAGRLKIGDEWMAIQIIARSQTNPQKAVAELVENSIDAGAAHIHILRGRRRGRVYLRISDDGRGVPLTPEGVPDFDYVATHICDSLKRRLDERERSAVQGEFGIGLLGFWSIGRELEMVSQAAQGTASVMTMHAGSRAYDRRRYLGARPHSGVDVTVHEVHREAQIRLTAEKLQRYLGEELRERIRRSGATIVIEDRLPPRKTLEVRPAAFRGEPIAGLSSIPVADHPPVRAELFVRSPEGQAPDGTTQDAEPPVVGLYRLGTRVCRNLADLPEFAREPWTSGVLEGMLDYADFHLAPATREGFLPDAAYHTFVQAVRRIEPLLLERLREEEEARTERASRSLVKELQSAFARLLRDLPAGVYDWFGAEGSRPFAGDGTGSPGGGSAPPAGPSSSPEAGDSGAAGEAPAGAPGTGEAEGGAAEPEELSPQPALLPGPLDRAVLRPAPIRVAVGRSRSVRASALDGAGLVIDRDLTYAWSLSPEAGVLSVETGGRAVIEAGGAPARGALRVTIRQETGEGSIARSAETEVLVEAEAPRRAFPPPKFVHAPGESWRSRWSAAEGKVEVNTGHPDYQAVRKSASKRRRYFGRLYGKELVLHNFGLETPAVALERLLEVLTRLDEHL
jgi:histidine kinase/DNA gyrase B/HSP90-like ATPase